LGRDLGGGKTLTGGARQHKRAQCEQRTNSCARGVCVNVGRKRKRRETPGSAASEELRTHVHTYTRTHHTHAHGSNTQATRETHTRTHITPTPPLVGNGRGCVALKKILCLCVCCPTPFCTLSAISLQATITKAKQSRTYCCASLTNVFSPMSKEPDAYGTRASA